jgi:dTDP-4-amino-4,6-dideoxygalactose transaminase
MLISRYICEKNSMKKFDPKNDMPLMKTSEGIVLFHPHMPKSAAERVNKTLQSRWIGHGPQVEEFEARFKFDFNINGAALAVGSGTDALHLAYLLAGIEKDDEVLTPLFTCTATNIPLLYIGAKPIFVDVNPQTLNICIDDLKRKITPKTKAIICVHYGGLPCDMDEIHEVAKKFNIPVIEDAAHALGAKYNGKYIGDISEFTMYSFQAIKHLTTGDGGMLAFKDQTLLKKAQRLRWFGIDRTDKQKGIWENDITEVGYKYQMTDIGASIGLAGLDEFSDTLNHRKKLFNLYNELLRDVSNINVVNDKDPRKEHAAWLFTILVENRSKLQIKLRSHGIESGQTHYRNDRYSIFKDNGAYLGMDKIDDKYLVLPLHTKMDEKDVKKICDVLKEGW